jgi:hypothetical protein
MAEQPPPAETRPEHPSVRHERTDANFRWILGLVIAAAVLGLVVFGVVWLLFREEHNRLAEARKSSFPLAPRPSTALPPEPRLEQLDRLSEIERSNVYVRQKAKEEILASYGATDEKGFVRIPIEQAMKVLATTKKLPVREEKAGPRRRDNGLVGGGEPNSGRLFNRRKPRWYGQ